MHAKTTALKRVLLGCLEWARGGITKARENNQPTKAQLSELPFEMVGIDCRVFQRAGLSCLSGWDDGTQSLTLSSSFQVSTIFLSDTAMGPSQLSLKMLV